MNYLTEYWEYPACTRCAHCQEPLVLTWSSSAVDHNIYHGVCHKLWKDKKHE